MTLSIQSRDQCLIYRSETIFRQIHGIKFITPAINFICHTHCKFNFIPCLKVEKMEPFHKKVGQVNCKCKYNLVAKMQVELRDCNLSNFQIGGAKIFLRKFCYHCESFIRKLQTVLEMSIIFV